MADQQVLYFDRCVGTGIPEALRLLGLKTVYHHHIECSKCGVTPSRERLKLFAHDTPDDEWMAFVASRGWIVISQDYSFHREPAVVSVIKQHSAKVFYLWGADARKHHVMQLFLNRREQILETAALSDGPFIYRVPHRGAFERIDLDSTNG